MHKRVKRLFKIPVMLIALHGVSYGYLDIGTEFFGSTKNGIDEKYRVEESVLLPLKKLGDGLLFTDIRQGFSDDDSKFMNTGFGIRHPFSANNVLGFYTFYDYLQSSYGYKFNQMSFGIESLSSILEIRGNAYMPMSQIKDGIMPADFLSSMPKIKINEKGNAFINDEFSGEIALKGVDGEVGVKLPKTDLTVYLGGYNFHHDNYKRIAGPRIRAKLSKKISDFATFNLYGRFQEDDVHGRQAGITLNLNFPIGGISKIATPLMMTKIERTPKITTLTTKRYKNPEVEILTDVIYIDAEGAQELFKKTENKKEDVLLLSAEKSAKDITEDIDNISEGALIILDGAKGDIAAKRTITMKPEQTLQSAELKEGLVKARLDNMSFNGMLLLPYVGTKPRITIDSENSFATNNPLLLLAEKNTVQGIEFDGAGLPAGDLSMGGILKIENNNYATIKDNVISSTTQDVNGILLRHNTNNNTISGNQITTNAANAHGICVLNGTSRDMGTNYFSHSDNVYNNNNIKTEGENSNAMMFYNTGYYKKMNANTISNNTIHTKGTESLGISFANDMEPNDSNLISQNNIVNNTINTEGSNAFGISLSARNDVIIDSTARNNTITTLGNGAHGIFFSKTHLGNLLDTIVQDNKITIQGQASNIRSASAQRTIISGNTLINDGLGAKITFESVDNEFEGNTVVSEESMQNVHQGTATTCAGVTEEDSKVYFTDGSTCPE